MRFEVDDIVECAGELGRVTRILTDSGLASEYDVEVDFPSRRGIPLVFAVSARYTDWRLEPKIKLVERRRIKRVKKELPVKVRIYRGDETRPTIHYNPIKFIGLESFKEYDGTVQYFVEEKESNDITK